MENTDVLVAGGGPVGLYLAGLLEKKGLSVLVLEEHKEIGKPNHCSGLVSRNLDLFVRPGDWIEHEVSGALIRSPSGFCLRMEKPGTAAYVIDRQKFDRSLAGRLESEIRLGERVEGVAQGEEGDSWRESASHFPTEGIKVKTNKGVYRAEMLVGCDGANSVVARHFGSRPKKLLMGVIAVTKEENCSDCVEIFLEKNLAPEGFFWKIPRGSTTEYGMFSSRADFLELERFFGIKSAKRRAGLIPLGPGRTYFNRAVLVGDAAGMSKPWSGGGVIFGLAAARIAAGVAEEAFRERDFSEGSLQRYEARWKRAFGRQIEVGMFGRRVFEKLENPEVEAGLKLLGLFRPFLNRMDMDFLAR